MMDFKKEFAKRLKELRKKRKLTQEQIAEIVNVDPRYISYIETAKSFPSCNLIERLCKALNITYSDLFKFEENMSNEELILMINSIMQNLDNKQLVFIYKIVSEI